MSEKDWVVIQWAGDIHSPRQAVLITGIQSCDSKLSIWKDEAAVGLLPLDRGSLNMGDIIRMRHP